MKSQEVKLENCEAGETFKVDLSSEHLVGSLEAYLVDSGFVVLQDLPAYDKETFRFKHNFDLYALVEYFKNSDFKIVEPTPLSLEKASTLFVTAGIQKLEDVIHKEDNFPDTPLFVNQPVLRSQFLGSSSIETHTSFHNLVTLDINSSFEKHLEVFKRWIKFLVFSGFEKEKFVFKVKKDIARLGDIKCDNIIIKVYYGGLELGDAVYIPSVPQKSRDSFSVSDIGFGLERITHDPDIVNTTENDCLKTLVLLAISGVQPSNHDHGYRFRMFSKKLVSLCNLDYTKLLNNLKQISSTSLVESWLNGGVTTTLTKELVIELVTAESERNFNREILNYLKEAQGLDLDININQGTVDFLNKLRITGSKPQAFWDSLNLKLKII